MTTIAPIHAGTLELSYERVGTGPDVLLLAGLGDPVEAWQLQLDALADRYRVTAVDNRGVGRTPLGDEPLTTAAMADDAAALLRTLGHGPVHVAGFSMGGTIAQELALRHPDLVRSLVLVSTFTRPDALLRAQFAAWDWLAASAPSEEAFYRAFFTWVYTSRAHADGTVDALVAEAMAFPHQQSLEGFRAQVDACRTHDTTGRLGQIAVPTLVVAGGQDIVVPPRLSHEVAAAIPGARVELMPDEAHQPFQEVPEAFNALVDAFWSEIA